ncbi:2-keto-4-pentenoate hydratase [Glaciimonas sp. GG7]
MFSHQITLAARHLVAIRHTGQPGPRLPENLRPKNNDDALQIQREVARLRGADIAGWKCASPVTDKIAVAPLLASDIVTSGPHCTLAAIDGMVALEPEIAFVIGTDLPPRSTPYSPDEIKQAIAATHLAFELIATRYAEPGVVTFPEKLADNLSNGGLLVGPAIRWENEKELAAIALTLNGPDGELGRWDGTHPDDNPLLPLYWLANFLAAHDSGLKRGQIVITGSYHGVIHVPQNDLLKMQYGALGTLDIEIGEPR